MTKEEAQDIADFYGLGAVQFQYRIALNTGKEFEVGYIFSDNGKELFCKCQSRSMGDFYLCNEFRQLDEGLQ